MSGPVVGKNLWRGTWKRDFQAFHSVHSWGSLADFHMGSFTDRFIMVLLYLMFVKYFSWVILHVFWYFFVCVAVIQRSECFGTRRPRSRGGIDHFLASYIYHTRLLWPLIDHSVYKILSRRKKESICPCSGMCEFFQLEVWKKHLRAPNKGL